MQLQPGDQPLKISTHGYLSALPILAETIPFPDLKASPPAPAITDRALRKLFKTNAAFNRTALTLQTHNLLSLAGDTGYALTQESRALVLALKRAMQTNPDRRTCSLFAFLDELPQALIDFLCDLPNDSPVPELSSALNLLAEFGMVIFRTTTKKVGFRLMTTDTMVAYLKTRPARAPHPSLLVSNQASRIKDVESHVRLVDAIKSIRSGFYGGDILSPDELVNPGPFPDTPSPHTPVADPSPSILKAAEDFDFFTDADWDIL